MDELEGVSVVDRSATLGGAYCAKLLGDAGATVTLVEPVAGAAMRRWSWDRDLAPGETGPLFRYLRHGHRSVTPGGDGRDPRLAALLAGADILIAGDEDTGGDAGAGAGPGAVVVSITPYGLTGPQAGRIGTEFTVQADSGALAIRGTLDRPPIQMGGRIVEWVAGAYAAFAALAAHRRQRATGDGDLIDVSLLEVANLAGTNFADLFHALAGRPEPASAARTVEVPSIEPTLDGWVGFNTNSRQQFESFCLLIERPDLIEDGGWASLGTRMKRADEWNAMVRDWTTRHTTAEIVEQAARLRVPVAPVCDAEAVVELDHVRARGVLIDDPTGSFLMPRRPWTIDGGAAPAPGPCPEPGEHDAEPAPSGGPRPRPGPGPAQGLPLAGVTVVDLTAWWAGPSSTALFAALGAEVVHVESTRRPDGMRMTGGAFFTRDQWWEYSSFFLQANTNKYGVTLDLDTPAGRELVLRLIERADLVVENFTPRVLEAFDLGWKVVHATNPRAVMVRMPAFGLEGPWRDRPGFAQTMEQVSGLAWVTGHPDDQPRIQRGPCDPNGGLHAAFAALVGLIRRDRTGIGCLVEAPMFEAALGVAAEPILEWTAFRNRVGRDGNRGPAAAPQGLYPCAGTERWLALAVATDAQWAALAQLLGRADLGADPALATREGRRRAHDRIDDAIRPWAAGRDLDDAVRELVSASVPAAAATDPRVASTHPQLRDRGYFEDVEHPVVGRHPVPTLPWRAAGVDRWIRRPAPTLGQHNHEIFGGWLGCDDDRLATLEADGVIGTWPVGI